MSSALGLAVQRLCLVVLLFAAFSSRSQPSNGVYREVYFNINGNAVSDLTSNPAFPNSPGLDDVLTNYFEGPANWMEAYGTRLRALITAPTTGNYTFWVSSDDGGELWLSTDATPVNRRRIAAVNGWTSSREWTKETNQMSAAIPLAGGQQYYIEALQKEGGGGDNVAVRWQLPGGTWENPADPNMPIPAARLRPYGLAGPQITQQPTNTQIVEGSVVNFSVRLARYGSATFQWQCNSTNIPGATSSNLVVGPVSLANNGAIYRCVIANWVGSTNSTNALLNVVRDTTPPTLAGVASLGDPQLLTVVFSEDVDSFTAIQATNYSLNGGITVVSASFGPDARTIVLETTPMTPNASYLLTVNNVRDRASIPNTIAPNSSRPFSLTVTPLAIGYVNPPPEAIGPSSRRGSIVVSEVMYHPTNRVDGKDLEFIEIHNTLPWYEDLTGYRITGAIEYTFPSNFQLGARSFAVVAKRPADVQSVYGIGSVLGPWNGSLQNGSGTLRIENPMGAVGFEMKYSGEAPYPAAADGAGHSLVLSRPSFGEDDDRAWSASDLVGGTPGTNQVNRANPFASVMINEIFAHSVAPDIDYIELYNYSAQSLNLGGCTVSDDPETNKFTIPPNTIIGPAGFIVLYETNLGFGLGSSGETVYLRDPQNARVIDCVRFGPQQAGIPLGRYPDGSRDLSRLRGRTPGTNNLPPRAASLVINEVMYHPISETEEDAYIEIYNPSTNAVDAGKWRLEDAVSFSMPSNTIVPAGGYLVIARNALRLRTIYPGLTAANCLGDWSGSLRTRGEHVALTMPELFISTNGSGLLVTNTHHVLVDEVTYRNGGRWGRWSDAGGSSLELRDPRSDHRLAPNWGDSDETAKSGWVNVEATGVMANGYSDATQLHVTLLGAGECLVDNVEVIPSGGANLLANSTFETGVGGWIFQGNHRDSAWESNEGYNSGHSLHLRATGRGDTGANRIRAQLSTTLSGGTTVTLRAKVRWLKGNPNILLRLRGNWHEASGMILTANNLGTPGARNSVAVTNAGPAITDISHSPVLPAAGQSVLVTARVNDPDGIASLLLKFRVDPNTNFSTIVMANNGGGWFSGTIPSQPTNGSLVAFRIAAGDRSGAATAFPEAENECVVMWGDTTSYGALPAYRFWVSRKNLDQWVAEEKMSNNPKDVTFIYGTNRVIYNAGAWYHGSPYHSPGYDSPIGTSCDYDLQFPSDDRFLGETDINLFRPGNGGGDGTGQAEIHAYWWASQVGIPFLFHRPVVVVVNRQRRDVIFHDAQQPNGNYGEQWYPNDGEGELHKVQLGFEFGDLAYGASEPGYTAVGASFSRFLTSSGAYHLPRYRQTLPLRSSTVFEQNDYTNLYKFVEAVLTNAATGSAVYNSTLTNATDVEEWYKVDVLQHLWENTDSFSYGGGQNAFIYKPGTKPWKLLLWDVDFAFGGGGTSTDLTSIGGADHGPRTAHPPFQRLYWQAIQQAYSLLGSDRLSILDARYNGLIGAGANVGSPANIKTFISNKRTVVQSALATVASPFSITSNGGGDFTSATNVITLSGSAPIDVRTIEVNGIVCTPTWTTFTNWSITFPLLAGTNSLTVVGRDRAGNVVTNATRSIKVNVTAPAATAQDSVAINEIMYSPRVPGAEYIELFNRSASFAFDLSRWRIDGIDYVFPDNTILFPRRYLVLARDAGAFAAAYGSNVAVFAEFNGNLQAGGETLSLVQPSGTNFIVIDKVRYDNSLPWPVDADGTGSSVQLVDAAQDHARVGNWQARFVRGTVVDPISIPARTNDGWRFVSVTASFGSNNRLLIFLDNAGAVLLDDFSLVAGSTPAVGSNYIRNGGFEEPLQGGPWSLGTNMTASVIVTNNVHSGNGALLLNQTMAGAAGAIARDLLQTLSSTPAINEQCTLGFWYWASNGTASNLTVRIVSSTFNILTNIGVFITPSNYIPGQVLSQTNYATPGGANTSVTNLAPFPPLWINELQAENVTGPADRAGENDPWIEIYNAGTNTVPLDGLYLSDNFTNLTQWLIPAGVTIAPGQFKLLFMDGQESQSGNGEFHAGFRLAPRVGAIALSRVSNGSTQVLDYIKYSVGLDRTFGSYSDGQPFDRREFYYATPGATNNGTLPPITVYINEWMADNLATLADPADSQYEDWFELYNPGSNSVSLAGYFLSDSLTNKFKYQIPGGYSIPAHGYLLVWADGETGQNSGSRPDLHVSFNLSKAGETVGLFTPDGLQIDAVTFGGQLTDISMGRFADGAASIYFMTNPTPRSANFYPLPNTPPVIAPVLDVSVAERSLVSVPLSAMDTDAPPQQLTWTLGNGAPAGATIDPVSGNVLWQTTEANGGAAYPFTVTVTDSGFPPLTATQFFTVSVWKTNTAPVLSTVADMTITAGQTLEFLAMASDSDLPVQNLTFSLDPGAPLGAAVDSGLGSFTWTPTLSQTGSFVVTIRVQDDGVPALSDSAAFNVMVSTGIAANELRLSPITLTNNTVTLAWPTTAGRTYRVEFTSDLANPAWTALSTNVANAAATSFSDTVATGQRIYRIVELP